MKFKSLPVTSLEDATVNFEQLSARTILDQTGAGVLDAPSGAMVSRTRALGTVYQPSTTRPTLVIVSFVLPSSGANCFADVFMDAANPPVTRIARAQNSNAAATLVQVQTPVTFLVPTGCFYEFIVGAGAPTIGMTLEYAL